MGLGSSEKAAAVRTPEERRANRQPDAGSIRTPCNIATNTAQRLCDIVPGQLWQETLHVTVNVVSRGRGYARLRGVTNDATDACLVPGADCGGPCRQGTSRATACADTGSGCCGWHALPAGRAGPRRRAQCLSLGRRVQGSDRPRARERSAAGDRAGSRVVQGPGHRRRPLGCLARRPRRRSMPQRRRRSNSISSPRSRRSWKPRSRTIGAATGRSSP